MPSQPVSIGDNGETANPEYGPVLQYFIDKMNDIQINYTKSLKEHRYHIRQMQAKSQPAYAPQYATGTIDSSGNLVLDLGGPQIGRRWVVRMVTFSDAGGFWNSMSSAKVTLAVGQKVSNIVQPQQVRWAFGTTPNTATFGSDQMWIVPRDHVLLSVTGGTSGEGVVATLWIQDFDVSNSAAVEVE